MSLFVGMILAAGALVAGLFLSRHIAARTGKTLGFGVWLACFLLSLFALQYTTLLGAAFGPWAEIAAAAAIMFAFGVVHGLNALHTQRIRQAKSRGKDAGAGDDDRRKNDADCTGGGNT